MPMKRPVMGIVIFKFTVTGKSNTLSNLTIKSVNGVKNFELNVLKCWKYVIVNL
jgi:hypothetical protein